jgi:hypothetical protein
MPDPTSRTDISAVIAANLAEIAQLVGGFSKFAARGAARRESDQ